MRRARFSVIAFLLAGVLLWHGHQHPTSDGKAPMNPRGQELIEQNLRQSVNTLANSIGERSNRSPDRLDKAARFVGSAFIQAGYHPESRWFKAEGLTQRNIVAVRPG